MPLTDLSDQTLSTSSVLLSFEPINICHSFFCFPYFVSSDKYFWFCHLVQVFSIKLDDWTHEQVDTLIEMGGNNAVNLKYEAHIPDNYKKPNPNSSTQERADFIR